MDRQRADGCLGSLHYAGSSGSLAQQVGSLVRDTLESRILRLPAQFLSASRGGNDVNGSPIAWAIWGLVFIAAWS
jgi:hypothetical protein